MKKETRQMFENYKWELVELAKKVGAIEQDRNKLEKFTKRLDTYQNRLAEIEQHNETGSQLDGTSMGLWRAAARKQMDTLEVRMDNLSMNDMGQAERIGKLERRLDGAGEDRARILEKYSDWDITTPNNSLIEPHIKNDLVDLMSLTANFAKDSRIEIIIGGKHLNTRMKLSDLRRICAAVEVKPEDGE